MKSRNAFRLTIFSLASILFFASVASAQRNKQERGSWEPAASGEIDEDCRKHLDNNWVDLTFRLASTEKQTLSRSAFPALKVEGSRNDGITVRGWDQADILVKACKMGAANDRDRAVEILNQVAVEAQNGRVTSRGPTTESGREKQFWRVQFIIYVPKDLEMELSAHNGGISLDNVEGKVKADVQNGGISLHQSGGNNSDIELAAQNGGISLNKVHGKVNARTANGGISLSDSGGEIKLHSGNGGISIDLPAGGWRGEGLEARTGNGGLVLKVPPGFSSGIEATTSGHSRLDCKVPECNDQDRDADTRRTKIKIGDGSPLVRVSTGNGSLQVVPAR